MHRRLLFLLSFFALASLLQASPQSFNIAEQSGDKALLAFSEQAGVEVLFSSEELSRLRTPRMSGQYEPKQALDLLLKGSGYEASTNGGKKFIVKRGRAPTGKIHGTLLNPRGDPAADVRVVIPSLGLGTRTDARGRFSFSGLEAGDIELLAGGGDFGVLREAQVSVRAGEDTEIEPRTLSSNTEPWRLDPFVVREGAAPTGRFSRDEISPLPRSSVGNIDLFRTESDALPFNIYNRNQIRRSGAVNLNEFLQQSLLDSDAATRPPEQDGASDSYSADSRNLSLRGYGTDETVLLMNGRRLPEMPTSGVDGKPPPAPDVNFIPLNLVERVEVLPVSASALYSGNPVGGVINIVLRPNVDATEFQATYKNALGSYDAPHYTASLLHGRSLLGGRLRFLLSLGTTRVIPPTEKELGYIGANEATQSGKDRTLHRATPNIRSADGLPLFGDKGASFTSVAPGADGKGGLAAFQGREGQRSEALFDTSSGFANSPDSVDYSYGRRQHGTSAFGSVTYDLRPWLQLGLDGIYTRSVINRGMSVLAIDLPVSATAPANPFGRDLDLSFNETAPLLGENYSEARLDFASVVGGLLLKLPREWRLSMDAQYGRSQTRYRGLAGVDKTALSELVEQGLYNPFRDTQVYEAPAAFYDKALVYYRGRDRFVKLGDYDTLDTAFRISNQDLALPTGHGALNLGADYRRNHLAAYRDERRHGDGSLAADIEAWAPRALERMSVFGELQAPLLPQSWLPRWIKRVETDLASRYVLADTSQESHLAPAGGLKIELPGGFALRGTVASSNRMLTPAMSRRQIIDTGGGGGGELNYVTINDPRRGEQYAVASSELINNELETEAAVTRSAGLVFQRGEIHRFRASVDLLDTRKTGEITFLDTQQIVYFESLVPQRVNRAAPAPGDTHSVGRITEVRTGNFNLAWRHSQNWVTSLDYLHTRFLGGSLELNARWYYYSKYSMQILPTEPVVDELGAPDGLVPKILRHRARLGATWNGPLWGCGFEGQYFHARTLPTQEWVAGKARHISAYRQWDVFVQCELGKILMPREKRRSLSLQLRVNNVLGTNPPSYANDSSGTGVQCYGDWRGRVYSLAINAAF